MSCFIGYISFKSMLKKDKKYSQNPVIFIENMHKGRYWEKRNRK